MTKSKRGGKRKGAGQAQADRPNKADPKGLSVLDGGRCVLGRGRHGVH